jgi:LCP family protein required for cell wall assembly
MSDEPTSAPREASGPAPAARRNFFRRHLALTALLVVFVLLIGSAGGFLWYLNHALGNIRHISHSGITPRLDPVTGEPIPDSGHPLNILILGSDDGDNVPTVADDLADGSWTRGAHRSDTIILVHLPADRKSAQVVSIPRDAWVRVRGFPGDVHGKAKINAAFSWGGPALAVHTIQRFTGLHVDHLAMIDWSGFMNLTDALGGVRIYIPGTFTDHSQNITWHRGWQHLDGERALQYVRTRHGLANGDFGLIERQQNFLRTIMGSLLSTGTFINPITLAKVVGTLSSFLQVDETWSTGDLRDLAWSSRDLRAGNVDFTTAPLGRYDTVAGQSIVRLDRARSKKLFRAFDQGDLTHYLEKYPGSSLPGDRAIK